MLRILPNVISDDILNTFSISADQFATLGSLYFFTYSLLQVPLGKITDIFGVHRVTTISILLCVIGCALFSFSYDFFTLQISRIVTGAGSAAALLCALKIVADHFPNTHHNLFMGITLTMGTLGALMAGQSLKFLLQYITWRESGVVFFIVGICLLLLFTTAVQRAKFTHTFTIAKMAHKSSICKSIYKTCFQPFYILKNRKILVYAILSIGFFTPLATLADLWGSIFLQQKFGLSHEISASTSLNLYLGLSVGSIFLPLLSEKYRTTNKIIAICAIMVFVLFSFLVYGPYISAIQLQILLCAIGFFCGAEMLCFSSTLEFKNDGSSGEVIGVMNTFNMMGCALLQQVVGFVLDYICGNSYSSPHLQNHVSRVYSVSELQYALSPIAITVALCVISALCISHNHNNTD